MDIQKQIENIENKILEMGLSDVPPRFIEIEELVLLKLKNIKDNTVG